MDTFQVLLAPPTLSVSFVTKINSKKAVQACIIVKDWENYDNLESTVTQVHDDRYALRAKVNAENYGFKDGCWWTLNKRLRSIKATPDQHRWNWKGSWRSCDVDDDKTNNDNNNHREENGTYI